MTKNEKKQFIKIDILIIFIILIIALGLRLYKINTPLADLHSWRQADTAAVARNFIKIGFDILHPKYDDLSAAQSGIENPQGLRFVEFPIYNALFAYSYKILPQLPIEIHGRLISIFFSMIIIAIVYYLALVEVGRISAIVAALVYATFPFFVFMSRTVLPETTATSCGLMAIFFLYLFVKNNNRLLLILSLLSFSIAILIKPTAGFYGIALLYLFINKYKVLTFKKISFYLYFIIAIIPFLWWRRYILNYPEGIPPNDWLITSVNTYQGLKNIFFRPAFFRWIFLERINNIAFGGYLSFFFLLGIITKLKKGFLHSILISALTYLFIFQGGNVQHEYYQIIILPALALFVGVGTSFIFENTKLFIQPILTLIVLGYFFGLSYFFSYFRVKDYYNYPQELPQIAKIVSTLTKPTDKIVTDRMGDTTLLYLMDRRGAPSLYKEVEQLKKLDYQYIVTLNKETIEKFTARKDLRVVFENNQFALFKL